MQQGRSEGGSWGARDPPPFVSLFLRKQPTIFRGENAMTIMCDPPPPFEKSWLHPFAKHVKDVDMCIISNKQTEVTVFRVSQHWIHLLDMVKFCIFYAVRHQKPLFPNMVLTQYERACFLTR